MIINIKPLSINEAFKGRRFKTKKYDKYILDVLYLLPKDMFIPEGKITLMCNVFYSNSQSDIDNFLKCFIDCLQKKYLFNDKMIYKLIIEKFVVKKGFEKIEFEIFDY